MSYDTNAKWIESMFPSAKAASEKTGVKTSVILAQWAHETGFGTSDLAKNANNFGGIKYYDGAPGQYGAYASYNSPDQYVEGYARVMNLDYYKDVRASTTPEEQIHQLDISPYAEDTQYGPKVQGIYDTYGLRGYDSWQGGGSSSGGSGGSGLSADQTKLLAIGAAAVGLFALLKD